MYAAVFARRLRSADGMTLKGEYRTEREAERVAGGLRREGFQTVVKVIERRAWHGGAYEVSEGSGSRPAGG